MESGPPHSISRRSRARPVLLVRRRSIVLLGNIDLASAPWQCCVVFVDASELLFLWSCALVGLVCMFAALRRRAQRSSMLADIRWLFGFGMSRNRPASSTPRLQSEEISSHNLLTWCRPSRFSQCRHAPLSERVDNRLSDAGASASTCWADTAATQHATRDQRLRICRRRCPNRTHWQPLRPMSRTVDFDHCTRTCAPFICIG